MSAATLAMNGVDAADDARFMDLALSLGRRGLGNTWPNPAVGALVVRQEANGPRIVGRGWTQPGGRPHAETEALRRAGGAARGATLYVTLEPCSHVGKTPPCADAIIAAGIARVVSALEDPNPKVRGGGYARLRAHGVTVEVGQGAHQAKRDLAGHIRRMRDGRPHVMLKLAVSADGKAGLPGRKPADITAEPARERAHLLRAMHDAILVGIGTALADDPVLTCRLPGMETRSPVRVVLDTNLRLPLSSRLVATARETALWLIAGEGAPTAVEHALHARGVVVLRVGIATSGRLDLAAVLGKLGERGVTRVMVEGGPTVAASLARAGLVDEAVLFRSPNRLGEGIDALDGLPLAALTQSLVLRAKEPIGPDMVEMFERV